MQVDAPSLEFKSLDLQQPKHEANTQMSIDFRTLLSTPTDTIKAPKPLPPGTYRGMITQRTFDKSKQKETPFVRFDVKVASAEADVPQEDLEGIDVSAKTLRKDYYLTPDASFRIVELAKSCGHNASGRSLGELIEDLASNTPFLLEVTQRPSQDGETFFYDIAKMRGVS